MPDPFILSDEDPLRPPTQPTLRGGDGTSLGRIDHYDLVRRLGGGGFGVVYLALDTASGVEVALKTLHPLIKRNAEAVEALRARFALVSRLAHPNIATALVLHPVRDANVWDESARQELKLSAGDSVMVMRYAPGTTLDRWRRQFEKGIAPLDKVVEIARQVAAALDYAHSEKVLHRDVSPRNIMVETLPGGALRVRVLDFGLASEIRSSLSRVSGDRGGTSGTRPYMAPEVWRGRKQDHRTDQYSFACVLYEALTGAPPFGPVFETDDPAVIRAAVENDDPFAVENVPDCVNEAFARALAKNRHSRFPTCKAFVDALAGIPAANAPAARALPKPTVQGRAAAPAPAPAGTPPSAPSSTPSSSGTEDAELEASVLARRLALSREVKAVPSRVRADPELGAFAAQADSAMAVAEDAIKFGRFAAADLALSRAKDALISIAATQAARAKAAEDARRKAAEEDARRKAEEAEARRKAAEEAAAKKKAEEEARRKAAAEAAARKKAEREAERKRREAEAAAQRAAEAERRARREAALREREVAARRAKAEEAARREAALRDREEAARRAKAEEAARREREALEKSRARAEREAKARAEAEKRAAAAAARREARAAASHRRRARFVALLPRIGRALAAVVAISVLGAGTLWFARSRGGAEPESHAEFAESKKFNSHAELAETAEPTSPGSPAGGAGERSEPEGGARAESESHAETAETAEPGGGAGPLAEGTAERSEAGGVARAEFESHAEPAETADPTSPGSPVGGAGERSEPEGVAERSEAGGVSRAEFESHAEAAEPGGTKPPHETSADVETHAKIAQNVAFELAYMLIQREQAMVDRDRLTLSGYGPAHPDRKTAEQKVVMLDGRIRELREMADYAEIVRSETKLSMERLRLASELKRKIGEMQKQGFGPNHPNVKSLHDSLELLLKRMEDARVSVIPLAPGVSLEMVHCPDIAPDFWMGKFEVTQEQWKQVMGTDPSHFKGAKEPVESVSWNNCQDFIRKLNDLSAAKASGLTFRLPTEEEWETACRAGAPKSARYCKLADGTEISEETLGRVAWFKDHSNNQTHPVGRKEPNAWGLYDMHGNVEEWTETADGEFRVDRGGSWHHSARDCESSFRSRNSPSSRFSSLGFRLCASGRPTEAPVQPEATAGSSEGKQAARSAAASRSEGGYLSDGLVAYYPFDGNAQDASGNGNHGTVNGATLTADRNGKPNHAYSFDGNDTIVVPDNASFTSVAEAFSIAAWVRVDNLYDHQAPIVSKAHVGDRHFSLELNYKGREDAFIGGYNNRARFDQRPEIGQWSHVVVTLDTSLVSRSYLDGRLVGTFQCETRLKSNDNSLRIGSDPCGRTEYLYGALDDLAIWNRALTADEVSRLYKGETPVAVPDTKTDGVEADRKPQTTPATTWYVDAAHGSDSNDGRSRTKAKKSIQAAIDLARDGQEILVADGIYAPIQAKGKSIVIRSVNGAEKSVIDGRGAATTLADFGGNTTNSVLVGFTLRNGSAGGVYGGIVRNSIIHGVSGSGIGWALAENCLVYGNSGINGGGAIGAIVRNCTIVGNTARDNGGGVYCCALFNSIVHSNSLRSGSSSSSRNIFNLRQRETGILRDIGQVTICSFTDDPKFVNVAHHDYRLAAGSPCIDAGNNEHAEGEFDLAGNKRIAGRAVDVGAYEFVGASSGRSPVPSGIGLGNKEDVPTEGLVARYSFDGNLRDSSGHGNHLEAKTTHRFAPDRFGRPNEAVSFEGRDNRWIGTKSITLFRSFSFSCWIRTGMLKDHSGTGERFWAYGNYPLYPWIGNQSVVGVGFKAGTDGISVVEHGPGYQPVKLSCSNVLKSDRWHHVCMVVESDTKVRVYLDGNRIGSGALSDKKKGFMIETIGGCAWGCYTGSIDDILVYDHALSDSEVSQIFKVQTANAPVSSVEAAGVFGLASGMVKPLLLGSGVSLEMVHCPDIAPDFWMGKYEVTQEQWKHVMGSNPSHFKGAKNPVESVSWNDCQEFVKKLNALPAAKETGLTFRLPTEEEWETACRAGAPKSEDYCKLADGTQITKANLSRVALFDKGWDDGPTEVGKNRKPNAWGLYDMHGNVWEWTQTADSVYRVRRGGSFYNSAGDCTAGDRAGFTPNNRGKFLGFRLAASGRTAAK